MQTQQAMRCLLCTCINKTNIKLTEALCRIESGTKKGISSALKRCRIERSTLSQKCPITFRNMALLWTVYVLPLRVTERRHNVAVGTHAVTSRIEISHERTPFQVTTAAFARKISGSTCDSDLIGTREKCSSANVAVIVFVC